MLSPSALVYPSAPPYVRLWLDSTQPHTNSCEFGPHVEHHDQTHYQRADMHKVASCLEDDGVRGLNSSGITLRLDAGAAGR
jgi:hypothetical protein